ncbi:hypothetical protein CHS0354_008786 [Potamilus streckersoni]|uniref:Mutator-like transposase domain-containing protein n=1 Tax=Potamilus streckersoni TaxID=2493646 RepID=A0AAE0VYI0_9BIVA|nr:hypothetical protein CHS0354_008786 [Potamilus streckersoni]
MADYRKVVKEFNCMIGNKTNIIDIQCDSSYNNAINSGVGKTPFQPATQRTHILVDDTTPEKVINITKKNKVCMLGKMHASDDEAKLCQCTANISLQTNIGDEYTFCKEGLLHLKKTDNLEVRNITDPDTASYRASLDLRREGITETVPVNHIDTRHLAQNHRKFIKGQSKLLDLMPGRTKKLREKMQNNFALDLTNISLQTNIGDEYTFCKEGLLHLKKTDNLEVRNITDPDTASYRASLDLKREGITETVPVNH